MPRRHVPFFVASVIVLVAPVVAGAMLTAVAARSRPAPAPESHAITASLRAERAGDCGCSACPTSYRVPNEGFTPP